MLSDLAFPLGDKDNNSLAMYLSRNPVGCENYIEAITRIIITNEKKRSKDVRNMT